MSRSSRSAAAAAEAMVREDNNNEDENTGGRSRRSSRSRQQTVFFSDSKHLGMVQVGSNDDEDDVDDDDDNASGEDEASNESSDGGDVPIRRKSSRSTAFRGEMKDPSNSIADLLKIADAEMDPPNNNNKKKRRGARQAKQRSSLEGRNESEEDDDEDDSADLDSPPAKKKKKKSTSSKTTKAIVKSPAKRHSQRRMSKRLEYPQSESSEEEHSEDEGSEVDSDVEEENEEEEEIKMNKVIACKLMKLSEWKTVCAKINTTEITNGSRWIQEVDESVDLDNTYEERFLVKWNDLSFLHCSWETEKDLAEFCEGAKARLSTFFRKAHNGLLYDADERLDGDYFDPSWISIERILEVVPDDDDNDEPAEIILDVNDPNFDSGTGRQFYIKWWNKPYSESSFEFERDLILNDVDYKEHLAQYEKRMVKPTRDDMRRRINDGDAQERKLYKIFGDKVKQSDASRDKLVKEYQNNLASRVFKNGGQLRDYQAEGVTWLMSNHLNNRGSILADEMGLGKTIQTATYVNTVAEQLATRGPFLVVAPLSTIPHWYREFTGWTDLNTIVYHGSANDRERAREDEFAFPGDRVQDVAFNQRYLMKVAKRWRSNWEKTWMVEVVITTPEMLVTDDFAELAAIKWEVLVVDEAHRLKNHNSKLAQNLRDQRFEFNQSLLLTGTPIQNNMQELWTLLNFINPDSFSNLNEFMVQYGDIKSKEKVDKLHETIRPYILRRLKEDVEKSVPPKEETLIEVELTVLQKQYYRALYEKNLKFLHRNKARPLDGPSINNVAMQLRKCCNHPFLLTGVETEVKMQNPNSDDIESMVNSSGKFVLLDKLLPRLQADGHRVLLFSQFKIMLDIIEDYLHLRRFKFERIDGSITGMKRQAAIDRFQSKDNGGREQPFIMLLSTRAGGVGINLTAADTCIIFDSDQNPQNDLQAQARCHRIGQTKNVKIYRLLTRKTYEMQMFHMASMKMGLDQAVLQGIENNGGKDIMTKEEVEKLLKHGAYDIFKEDKDGTSEKESNDFVSQDIDSILARRAKTVIHDNTGSNSNAAGGTFSKASFKSTNSDGVSAAEIDVDDPDFWTKVVGEAKKEEDEQLGKRIRAQQSYSEKDYHKRLNAAIKYGADGSDNDDNASLSSEFSEDSLEGNDNGPVLKNDALESIVKASKSAAKERFLWGGSARSEWKQADAEVVVKSLGLFGFGNVSWAEFNASLSLSKSMKLDDIKRMCWSLTLMCLYEAAEDDALEASRKAEVSSKQDQSRGDVLASTLENDVVNVDESPIKSNVNKVEEKDLLEESFKVLLAANKSWADLALAMASDFSCTSSTRRDLEYVQSTMDGNLPSKSSHEANAVQSKLVTEFFSKIWPALRTRGWKNDEKKSSCFMHQNKTFNSITAVLDVIPKYYPELVEMTDGLISSVKASCVLPATPARRHELGVENVTAKSLKLLLMDCAPMQLLADRKRAQRISLTKRLLTKLVLLYEVHKAVNTADSHCRPEDSLQERNAQLRKVINIQPWSSTPHPEWTLQHDAVLLRAVVKHGWIDSHAACLAIGNDKTIRWGAPFEVSDQTAVKDANQTQTDPETERKLKSQWRHLYNTATRAVMFLQELNETYVDVLPTPVLNELRERMIDSFCLTRGESDENWTVNESELQKVVMRAEKRTDECEALPSRKKLLKRIKKIAMSFAGAVPDGEKDPLNDNSASDSIITKKHGFFVIDQSKHQNILVAVMIQGLLVMKRAAKTHTVKSYAKSIFGEIDLRIEDLMETDESDPLIQVLEETKKGILLYSNNLQKHARAAKNILRVMLGQDPVPSKVPTESLFPTEEKPTAISDVAKVNLSKLKKKKSGTPADNVLTRVFSYLDDDADGINECLHLTSTEILMLTVLSSQGLPVFSDEWSASFADPIVVDNYNESGDDEFRIFFSSMTQVLRAAADVWLSIARKKLQQATHSDDGSKDMSDKKRLKISILKKDYDAKDMAYHDAISYSNDPMLFAKKCIVLLEAIRKNMGSVDLQYAGDKKIRQLNKSENGLGTKVLHWFSKDLQKWATSLGVIDKYGNVQSATSITSKKDHPQSNDAALMSKRDCRTVFIQIAQQTRLRSIFTMNSMEKLSTELVPRVLNQTSFVMTEWEDCPPWWNVESSDGSNCNCQDDCDLLTGILDYGYGGFDSLLQHDYSFCRRLASEEDEDSSNTFSRSTAQIRINHLTRELHANVEREEMMKLVQKRRQVEVAKPSASGKKKYAKTSGSGGIQSGLSAFFKISSNSNPAVAKRKTPPTSPENCDDSDVEIIEIIDAKKSKSEMFHA